MPEGTALYLRRIKKSRHGSPTDFALKCADHGMGWIAIAGPFHDASRRKMINKPKTVREYSDALAKYNVEPWVWGYPWQGSELLFAQQMRECAGDHKRGLLDPERGANPLRRRRGPQKDKANEHAHTLVSHMKELGFVECYLSTFGNGWRMHWFPFLAFIRALLRHFRGRTGIGGQTYTDDGVIDRSIADMINAIHTADPSAVVANTGPKGAPFDIEVVPNFGTYSWDTPNGKRTKDAKARRKRPEELAHHLMEFIDDGEPVDAMIGWAENFMTKALWRELAKFNSMMKRGACRLPK